MTTDKKDSTKTWLVKVDGHDVEIVQNAEGEFIVPQGFDWRGYGTALKPAWEPFIVGRKP